MEDMESNEITSAIVNFANKYGLGHSAEFKLLYNSITSSPKRERYLGIMGVFGRDIRDNKVMVQTFAGRLLLKISPKPIESCEEAIFRLLPYWDVSAEEVIFYLREKFGKPEVIKSAKSLQNGQVSERNKALLDSVIYWLGCRER